MEVKKIVLYQIEGKNNDINVIYNVSINEN